MFNTEKYQNIINKLLDNGLEPSTNWNGKINSKTLFLRHDVDFSIDFAHSLAKFEFNQNVQSTYFFMLTSNMYNLFSNYNRTLVKNIAEMGHKISLHFDPSAYESLEKFLDEKKIFENTFKINIEIVSIHRPRLFLNDNNINLSGIAQTYQDIYFKKMKYISDSGGRDIFSDVIEYLKKPNEKGLHLLTHPIWWVGKGDNPTATLNFWRDNNANFITSQIRNNCKTYTD